jgi:hypothetical protein
MARTESRVSMNLREALPHGITEFGCPPLVARSIDQAERR